MKDKKKILLDSWRKALSKTENPSEERSLYSHLLHFSDSNPGCRLSDIRHRLEKISGNYSCQILQNLTLECKILDLCSWDLRTGITSYQGINNEGCLVFRRWHRELAFMYSKGGTQIWRVCHFATEGRKVRFQPMSQTEANVPLCLWEYWNQFWFEESYPFIFDCPKKPNRVKEGNGWLVFYTESGLLGYHPFYGTVYLDWKKSRAEAADRDSIRHLFQNCFIY